MVDTALKISSKVQEVISVISSVIYLEDLEDLNQFSKLYLVEWVALAALEGKKVQIYYMRHQLRLKMSYMARKWKLRYLRMWIAKSVKDLDVSPVHQKQLVLRVTAMAKSECLVIWDFLLL